MSNPSSPDGSGGGGGSLETRAPNGRSTHGSVAGQHVEHPGFLQAPTWKLKAAGELRTGTDKTWEYYRVAQECIVPPVFASSPLYFVSMFGMNMEDGELGRGLANCSPSGPTTRTACATLCLAILVSRYHQEMFCYGRKICECARQIGLSGPALLA